MWKYVLQYLYLNFLAHKRVSFSYHSLMMQERVLLYSHHLCTESTEPSQLLYLITRVLMFPPGIYTKKRCFVTETFGSSFQILTVFKMGKTRGRHCSWPTLLLRELSVHM